MKNEFPDSYCIKLTEDNVDLLRRHFTQHYSDINIDKTFAISIINGEYYSFLNKFNPVDLSKYQWSYNNVILPEITIEQFRKHVLKEETMDRKIIGYKLIKPEYEKIALKALGLQSAHKPFIIAGMLSYYVPKVEELGIMDWFEPVYEAKENFNVGDWITYIKGYIPPYTTQIQSIGHDGWIHSNINKPDGGHYHYSQYRKATPEEIKTAQEIKMPFGNIEVVVTKDYVIYTRENVKVEFSSVSDFLASIDKDRYLSKKLGTFKITITDDALIKIGCEIGTLGQIRDIYDKMKELQ